METSIQDDIRLMAEVKQRLPAIVGMFTLQVIFDWSRILLQGGSSSYVLFLVSDCWELLLPFDAYASFEPLQESLGVPLGMQAGC